MPDALQFATLAFTSLLAIVNPVGAVPIYVAMTAAYDRDTGRLRCGGASSPPSP